MAKCRGVNNDSMWKMRMSVVPTPAIRSAAANARRTSFRFRSWTTRPGVCMRTFPAPALRACVDASSDEQQPSRLAEDAELLRGVIGSQCGNGKEREDRNKRRSQLAGGKRRRRICDGSYRRL